jgi:YgiT-type zinc finger domain-containing protein
MASTKCPICGNQTLERKCGEYFFEHPHGKVIVVPNTTWDVCSSCGEEIFPDDLTKILENNNQVLDH